MDKDDEFRRKAAEAQGWADEATNEDDRAAWLDLVRGWLGMIRRRPQTAAESFEEQVTARDTHQERSDKSH